MSRSFHPRILMSFCTDRYWYDVAKSLIESGVNIDFLVSRPPQIQALARKELKNTTVINQDTLEYPSQIRKLNEKNPIILTSTILSQLRECESEFLNITDRLAFFPLTVARRREIFKELVKYWYYFLSLHKLDAIFFTDTPHVGFDTVLFAVAKIFFNLPIVSVRRPFIRDRMLLVSDYRKYLPKVPESYLIAGTKKEIQIIVGPDLITDVYGENPWQKEDRQINQSIQHSRSRFSALFQLIRRANLFMVYAYLKSLFEMSRYGGFNYNDGQLKLIEKLCGIFHRYHLRKQRCLYDELAAKLIWPIRRKYIYFPLHLQPERSTMPEGGIFEDQLLVLEILHESLPKGWIIIVKEHPRQFQKHDFQKHSFRSLEFYRKIASFSSVYLCPMHIPQGELIEGAQLTATITGTGGWESLMVNKPTFIFGNAWYGSCQSSYLVDSPKSAYDALKAVRKKNKLQVELDVLRFLAYYRNRLVVASNAKKYANQSPRLYNVLVKNMAIAVKDKILAHI